MNVSVPLLEGCQKCNFLPDGTIIHIVGEPVDCLQDGFFRAHTLNVSLRILDASPAFKPNVRRERRGAKDTQMPTGRAIPRPLQAVR